MEDLRSFLESYGIVDDTSVLQKSASETYDSIRHKNMFQENPELSSAALGLFMPGGLSGAVGAALAQKADARDKAKAPKEYFDHGIIARNPRTARVIAGGTAGQILGGVGGGAAGLVAGGPFIGMPVGAALGGVAGHYGGMAAGYYAGELAAKENLARAEREAVFNRVRKSASETYDSVRHKNVFQRNPELSAATLGLFVPGGVPGAVGAALAQAEDARDKAKAPKEYFDHGIIARNPRTARVIAGGTAGQILGGVGGGAAGLVAGGPFIGMPVGAALGAMAGHVGGMYAGYHAGQLAAKENLARAEREAIFNRVRKSASETYDSIRHKNMFQENPELSSAALGLFMPGGLSGAVGAALAQKADARDKAKAPKEYFDHGIIARNPRTARVIAGGTAGQILGGVGGGAAGLVAGGPFIGMPVGAALGGVAGHYGGMAAGYYAGELAAKENLARAEREAVFNRVRKSASLLDETSKENLDVLAILKARNIKMASEPRFSLFNFTIPESKEVSKTSKGIPSIADFAKEHDISEGRAALRFGRQYLMKPTTLIGGGIGAAGLYAYNRYQQAKNDGQYDQYNY
jgi:hypothetical protein